MDIATVSQLVTTVGFPIACCLGMAWFVVKQTNSHREEIAKLNEQHKEEMNTVSQAINNNTIALTKLCERLGGTNEC